MKITRPQKNFITRIKNFMYTLILATSVISIYSSIDAKRPSPIPSKWKPLIDKCKIISIKAIANEKHENKIKKIANEIRIGRTSPFTRYINSIAAKKQYNIFEAPLHEKIIYYLSTSEGKHFSYVYGKTAMINIPFPDTVVHESIHLIGREHGLKNFGIKAHHTICAATLSNYINNISSVQQLIEQFPPNGYIPLKYCRNKKQTKYLRIIKIELLDTGWRILAYRNGLYELRREQNAIILRNCTTNKIIYRKIIEPIPADISNIYPETKEYYSFLLEHADEESMQNTLSENIAYNAIELELSLGMPGAGFTYIRSLLTGHNPLQAEYMTIYGLQRDYNKLLTFDVLDAYDNFYRIFDMKRFNTL